MEQDVFRLQVAVDNVVFMHILHCGADLPDILPDNLFSHLPIFLQILVQVLAKTGFQHQIGRFFVDKEVVELNDAGVVEERLDLHLPD